MKAPRAQIIRLSSDPYAALVAAVDGAFMSLYAHMRRERRRFTRIALALLPLMVLLVGSCKTSGMADAYGTSPGPEQFRTALFPDSVNAGEGAYHPALGYVSRAQTYIKDSPEALKMMTDREIAWMFGKPALKRRDADAKIWQYKAKSCVVDFYFYDDPGHTAASAVSYVDVRLIGSANGSLPEKMRAKCLGRVMDDADFSAFSKA